MPPPTPERYFYHAFPRRGGDDPVSTGLRILELMIRYGLLLTLESVTWHDHGGGRPGDTTTASQRRICFTELSRSEVTTHAHTFGPFAVEYSIAALREMGAAPVIYVPDAPIGSPGLAPIWSVALARLADTYALLGSLDKTLRFEGPSLRLDLTSRDGEKSFREFDPAATSAIRAYLDWLARTHGQPYSELAGAMRGITNLVYPTENYQYVPESLHYYRQREWRIVSGSYIAGMPTTRVATSAQVEELLALDQTFFSRTVQLADGRFPMGERSHFLEKIGDKHVIAMAGSIIVPRAAAARARTLLEHARLALPVIVMEDLVTPA